MGGNIVDLNLKNNPLIYGFIGAVIGTCGTLGTQALINTDKTGEHINQLYDNRKSVYKSIPKDDYGDAYITPSGTKYHCTELCSALSRSRNLKQVNSEDAQRYGLDPCSRCY